MSATDAQLTEPEFRRVDIALPATGDEEWHAIREPLQSGWLTQGPKVAAFERAFAERHTARHAVAVSNCTTGLHIALLALGVGPGDEVIVPGFSWVSTANAVVYCGATPVFIDIDPATFNIDTAGIAAKLSPRTKAIVPVHLFGLPADMDAIRAVVPAGVGILEDAACAAGAAWRGQPVGTLGDVAAFSFHPRKSITTGEGGMLTTADDAVAERLIVMRSHGCSVSAAQKQMGPRPWMMPAVDELGFNYRLTDIQAAIGLVQLQKLDRFIEERDAMARAYADALAAIPWLQTPEVPAQARHAWQSYVIRIDEARAPKSRNAIMETLARFGVSTRPGTQAIHMLGYYADRFGLRPDDLPQTRDADRFTIALPLHNRMTDKDQRHVVACLHAIDRGA